MAAGLDTAQGLGDIGRPGGRRRLGGALWRRTWLRGLLTLSPPVVAFLAIYVAALLALFVYAFWTVNPLTSEVVHTWTLDNFRQLWQSSTYRDVAQRTILIAAAVTITDAIIAFPFAYFMARLAGPRLRAALFVLVLLPLWASYLARVYAWQLILNNDGLLNWSLQKVGLPPANLAYTNTAMWIVFSYVWLPFMILPVYAALERIPHSYIEASRDLGAGGGRTFRSGDLPARATRNRRRLDLHVLADTRGLHHPAARRRHVLAADRQCRLRLGERRREPALRGGVCRRARGRHGRLSGDRAPLRRVRGALVERRSTRIALWIWVALVLAFLYVPILIICLYAFNESNVQSWPIPGLTTKWFSPAIHNPDMQSALWLSLKAAALATTVALVLGTLASFGVHRFRFFGREAISFLLVLPIALPGIITGMALNSYFTYWKLNFGLLTIVIGHATFCVVVVYNNVIARLRRVPGSLTEASMDLGADGLQTFRHVTFPTISTALISGGLLAFALSFDEVIVTTFTAGAENTLPIWIFGQIRLGQQLPQVNVVVFLILIVTIIPVALAQRLTSESGILRTE